MKSKAVFFIGNKNAEIREIDIADPMQDEVQVKTIYNGICMLEVWKYNYNTFDEPFLAGHEGLAVVTKVGKNITGIREGDYVISGVWSEYINIHQNNIINLSCRQEIAEKYIVEPAACAVNAVSYSNIYPGDRVIVFGAGYMGLLLIQILNHSPISELVVVDVKEENLRLAQEYGATKTINLLKDGNNALHEHLANPFDICYEASSAKDALDWCTRLAKRGGKIGIYSWHHDSRLVDTSEWHVKGLQVLNVSPKIAFKLKDFIPFQAADKLMGCGKVDQQKLITHQYAVDDVQKAMQESSKREGHFIKSILKF